MLRNYFAIVFRSILRNKLYFFLNVLGMGIAIACCVVAYLSYKFNSTFDQSHLHSHTIYRVNSVRASQNSGIISAVVPLPMGDLIKHNESDVDAVIRYTSSFGNFRIGEEIFNTQIDYFDTIVFQVFSFKFLTGSPNAIRDKTKIIISNQLAKKLFGNEPALGKTVIRTDINPFQPLEIGGVIEDPVANSSFHSIAIMNYQAYLDLISVSERDSWKIRNTLFVQVKNRNRTEEVEKNIRKYALNNNQVNQDFIIERFGLDPMVGMAVRDEKQKRADRRTALALPSAAIIGPSVMAIFILLIACFNFINTFLFMASARLKEIGIRKILGGVRTNLIFQFMGETLIVCFISIGVGILVAELLIPAYNQLWPFLKLKFNYTENTDIYVFLGFLLIIISVVSGSYPALYISKFQPIQVLNGKLKFGSASYLSYLLLTLQFAISGIGVISAMAFYNNAKYQQKIDLGYDQKGVIFTPIDGSQNFNTYKNALASNSKIISIGGAKDHFNARPYGIRSSVKSEDKEVEVFVADIGENYLKTCGIVLRQGRDFIENSETDKRESVIISENLVKQFGWNEPLGKEIYTDTTKYYVVGVVKNVLTHGLWQKPDPLVFRYRPDKFRFLMVSALNTDIAEVNEFMKAIWKKNFANILYKGELNDRELVTSTLVNTNIVKMFLFLGITALALAGSGLFTSVSLTIVRKLKEIGIRKICGAPISRIAKVLGMKYIIIIAASSLIGIFLSKILCRLLMESLWEYYLPANLMIFVLSTIIIFGIAICTIFFQVMKAANLNPAEILKEP